MNKEKNKIKQRNQRIMDSVKISQARRNSEGFKVFETFLRNVKTSLEFPSIFSIKDEETRIKQQGKTELMYELVQFIEQSEEWSKKKMKDEDTGNEEVLTKK